MLQTRTPTKAEAEWLFWVKQLPCIVCARYHQIKDTPAEIHHLEGRNIEFAHLRSIPLCTNHHRTPDNQKPKRWTSRHGDGKDAFERRYTSEAQLLAMTTHEIFKIQKNTVGNRSYESDR